jgi:hypothetical protein
MNNRCNLINKYSFIKDIFHLISRKIEKRTIVKNFIIVSAFTLLTILLTYPVAFTTGNQIPGGGDTFQWMHSLWYTNYAIFHPEITSLHYINMIFYPTGIPIMPFTSAFNQIITILLLPLCQIQVIYSFLWLLSFILAAFGAFLLVRYLTQNDYAAFLSGIIFAFTPFHLVHGLGHMGATTIQWIPFCALFFMKVFREGGIKNCIIAGIFYILVAMSDMQYMIFMGIFIAVLFLYEHFISLQENKGVNIETHKSILIKYLIIGIVAFSIILPLTITDIQTATSGNNFLKPNPLEAVTYSTDLLSFFLPSPIHPIFGAMVNPIYHNFTGNNSEHTTYIGYTVLFLSIFALFVFRKDLTVRFWGIIALFFSLLSMGPVLHVAGKTVFTVFKISVPLPHLILYYLVPFLDNSRTTGRFFIVAALAFAVLAGYGCSELIKRYDTKKIIIVTLLCTFIIIEYMSIPFPTSPVDQPAFYQKIGQDPDHYALLEIPITANYGAGVKIIYYQTIHGKPVVGGQAGRTPLNARDFERNTPFINEITFLKPINDILIQEKNSTSFSVLEYYNIRYIILHKKYLHPNDLIFAQDRINQLNTTIKKIVENEEYIVYWVEDGPYQEFLLISDGWNALEQWKDGPGRWMRKDARITIISPEDRDYLLSFEVGSLWKNRDLSVYINNELVQKFLINTTGNRDITPDNINILIHANKGENLVKFSTSLPGSIPSEIGAWNDKRELSLAFQKIQIRPIFIQNNTHDYKTECLEKSHDNLTFKAHLIDDKIPESEENGNYLFAVINITNQGIDTWNVNNPNPVYISYHWLQKNQTFVFDGIRTNFPNDIQGGQSIQIKMIVKTPDEPGNYTLENSEKPGLGFYLSTVNEKYGWIRGVFSRATVCKCCGIRRQAGRD